MAKIIFILQRREDISRDRFLQEWSGERHIGIAKKIPGLRRLIQNHPVSNPTQDEPPYDGIAELWFDNSETMERAFDSPEWAAAIEDGQRYADFTKSRSLVVKEIEVC